MEFIKYFLLFTLVTSSCAFAPQLFRYQEGQNYFFTNDENGELQLVDLTEVEPEDAIRSFKESHIKILLYTRSNNATGHSIDINNVTTLTSSFFNKKKPVKVIIHGWNNNYKSDLNTLLTKSFLAAMDVNVFVIDWSKGSNTLYTTAAGNAVKAGTYVADILAWVIKQGISAKNIHVLGHSLGAHVSGIAGRHMSVKLGMISGFDPAAPLWSTDGERIRSTDADYVEIIHSDAGGLGIVYPAGHNDFYPNGGSSQPGCSWLSVSCNHGRSYEYYAYSLENTNFMANLCTDYYEATKNKCSNLAKMHMGGTKSKSPMGSFYLTTTKKAPYYQV